MGWSFHKSFGKGPFRVNVSRSGVGFSVGGRGFRTGVTSRGRRYTSVGIPGTGLRYRTTHGKSGCLLAGAAVLAGSAAGLVLLLRSFAG